MRYAYGVDVGGTNIKVVVTGENGVIAYRESFPTPHEGPESIVAAVCLAIKHLDEAIAHGQVEETYGTPIDPREVVETIGVAVPGIVDEAAGLAVFSINLGWRDFPMRRAIANASGRAIALGHDVRSGALAESRWGAGADSCLYLALGTGVSAALILNGQSVAADPWAGEVGQGVVIDPDDHDSYKRVEELCSAAALSRRLHQHVPDLIEADAGARQVFALAAQGNEDAASVIDSAVHVLAHVIAASMHLTGPLPVVLGGGMSQAGDALLQPLQKYLSLEMPFIPHAPVKAAELGTWSQAMGCCARALDADALWHALPIGFPATLSPVAKPPIANLSKQSAQPDSEQLSAAADVPSAAQDSTGCDLKQD